MALTVKTDDVTRGRKDVIRTGGYGRFRGEWVNQIKTPKNRLLPTFSPDFTLTGGS